MSKREKVKGREGEREGGREGRRAYLDKARHFGRAGGEGAVEQASEERQSVFRRNDPGKEGGSTRGREGEGDN